MTRSLERCIRVDVRNEGDVRESVESLILGWIDVKDDKVGSL